MWPIFRWMGARGTERTTSVSSEMDSAAVYLINLFLDALASLDFKLSLRDAVKNVLADFFR